MKTKRLKGHCRLCGEDEGEENLSNSKLCYDCAKNKMLFAFNVMWDLKHKKRG